MCLRRHRFIALDEFGRLNENEDDKASPISGLIMEEEVASHKTSNILPVHRGSTFRTAPLTCYAERTTMIGRATSSNVSNALGLT